MDNLIRNALDEIFQEIVSEREPNVPNPEPGNDDEPIPNPEPGNDDEPIPNPGPGNDDEPIPNPEPYNPLQENEEFINTNYDDIPMNPMNQMNMNPMNMNPVNPMNMNPVNPMNMNPIGIQVILGGLGIRGRGMNILERSFQEQEVKDAPICDDFKQTLTEIPITLENQTTYTCAICQDNPDVGDTMIELPCKNTPHYFHKGDDPEKCGGILSWFETNHFCPICRTEFPKKEEGEDDDQEDDDQEDDDQEDDEIVVNIPLQDIIQAGGMRSMMNHIMRDIQEQREEDDIQQAIMRSFEES